ncbi:MAG TPA: LysM peptidoglycan-binding domain-containing protein [Gemmatimonadales bacterium]|nr:LysM peptidoglycan-binding domain-containing protein [Gemmatimonadales bacterium]
MLHASPAIASLLVLLAALGASVTRSPDAASAWREAERSVEWMLVPGERMLAGTRVVRRHWGDHFRATHGVLVATDRRLLYAGVLPRSLLGTSDGPPLIERIAVPLDTLLEVSEPPSLPGGWERLTIRHGETTARFSVAAAAHDRALAVVAIATRARDMAAARAARELFLQDSLSALPPPPPMMHVVRAGETVIGIAARYGLSPEELMERNGLASDRVRAGQRLTVREFRRVGSMVEAY